MIESLLQNLTTDAAGESLSALCSEAKTKAGRAAIEAALSDRSALYSLLKSDSPKVRKNTYRLIGALQNKEDIRALEEALQTETTLFAVPSLLLALGALGAKDALCRYTVPASEGPEQDQHIAAIEAAYEKATQQFDRVKAEPLCRLPAAREILCCAPKGFAAELADELDGLGFSGTVQGDAVRIVTADVARVYRAACMTEALLPIAEKVPLEPAAIAKAAGKCIGTRYRIELRGYLKDRAKLIERLKTRLDGVNSASNYDCELRIQCSGSAADLFWKLWNVPDERYPWRRETVPASIHPATAAALARYARRFAEDAPVVFDPFCGSGALLFSAEAAYPCRGLLGVDLSGKAVEIARRNAKAGKSKARFVCRDILRFQTSRGATLLISNMPFGNRVGSHRGNEALYARFVQKLPSLLAPGGAAILYTAEGKLLERLLQANPRLELLSAFRTEAGGLSPWVFAVRNRVSA